MTLGFFSLFTPSLFSLPLQLPPRLLSRPALRYSHGAASSPCRAGCRLLETFSFQRRLLPPPQVATPHTPTFSSSYGVSPTRKQSRQARRVCGSGSGNSPATRKPGVDPAADLAPLLRRQARRGSGGRSVASPPTVLFFNGGGSDAFPLMSPLLRQWRIRACGSVGGEARGGIFGGAAPAPLLRRLLFFDDTSFLMVAARGCSGSTVGGGGSGWARWAHVWARRACLGL